MSNEHPYLQPASRVQELYAGLFVLAASVLLGYFGVRGALMFLAGSRSAPADPVAAAIGILTGIGGGYLGVRLLVGWRNDRALLPTVFLLLGGVGSLAGAMWFISINRSLHGSIRDDMNTAYVFGLAGVLALVLSWRRWRGRAS